VYRAHPSLVHLWLCRYFPLFAWGSVRGGINGTLYRRVVFGTTPSDGHNWVFQNQSSRSSFFSPIFFSRSIASKVRCSTVRSFSLHFARLQSFQPRLSFSSLFSLLYLPGLPRSPCDQLLSEITLITRQRH
ncbi:hypothetical protein BO79DRAFT_2302, partial [Aspergillus costaricaensis CBS 115574]